MKRAHLRAAVHNLVDSLSSEDSRFIGYGRYPGLWDFVDQCPGERLSVELLRGEVEAADVPGILLTCLRDFIEAIGPFLREQQCDPGLVRAIRVEFRRAAVVLPSRKEAVVSIELEDGTSMVDRYIGDPLKRPKYLDIEGRARTDRRKPFSAPAPSAPASFPPDR